MRWVKWPVRALAGLALIAAAGAGWLVGTESGLRWALGFAPPEIELEGARGALAGTVSFERVAFQGSEARNVALGLDLLALAVDTVSLEFVRIETLRLTPPPASRGPDTSLPVRIRISDAQVRSVVFEGYEIHDLQAQYAGSAAGHEAEASFSFAGARAKLDVSLKKEIALAAELRGLNLAVLDPELPQTALRARLRARGARSALAGTLTAENPEPGPLDRERLPFARVATEFSTDLKSVELREFTAAVHPAGSLQGKGSATLENARFDVRVAELDLRAFHSNLRSTLLAGALELDLSRQRQRVKGRVAQADMSLSAEAERIGDDVEVRALHARAGDSEATGSGRVHLGEPKRFAADLRLARFDPARFGDYPAGSINGTLKARGGFGGSGSARWDIGDSTLLGLKLASRGSARLAGERILDGDAWLTLGANRVTAKGSFGTPRDRIAWTLHVPDLDAIAEGYGGDIRASGTASGTWTRPSAVIRAQAARLRLAEALVFEQASLDASGTLERHEGQISARGSELNFKAVLRGAWRSNLWRGEIAALRNEGAYPLELKTPAALEAGPRRVALGRFEAELAGARASVESVRWQDRRLTSEGRIRALPAQWALGVMRFDKAKGDLTLDGDWALAATPKLNGRVSVRRAGGDLLLGDTPMELARAALEATFKDDRVAASADVATPLGKMQLQGSATGLAPDSALAFGVEIEAPELRTLTEPLWTQARVSGRVAASLRIGGTWAAPALSGTLRGDALGLDMPPWGIALRDGRVRAELDANRLRVTEARIAGGEGTFSARGVLPLGLEEPATLEWQATRIRLLGRPDRRLIASGKGTARFDGKRLGLAGELRADSGHFEFAEDSLPQLADDVEIVGPKADEVRVTQRGRGQLPLELDLKLDLGEQLTLRAYGFNGGVSGEVRLTTSPAGELLAHGRVHAVRARFFAYGQQLDVDPGALLFAGPIDAPGIDITAWRRHQQVEAGIHLTGTVQVPHVELVSKPPVNESEKLSWLVLGRAPTNASGADLAVLQAASGAMFGHTGQAPMHRRFAERFGFDELTVRSSSDLAGNVVALGKRYSDNVYFSFEQAIGTTTEHLVKLDYALTQRLSLRGQTGTTSGVGLFYRFSWD